MKYTDAQKEATARYNKKAYDRINVIVKKGQRQMIKEFAASQGKSLNRFICDAIAEKMNENEEERCIELLRKTEEQLDEFPQAILCFDFCLFDKLIKRIIVLSDSLVFEFRCEIKLRETI